jgi:hypothetical protein
MKVAAIEKKNYWTTLRENDPRFLRNHKMLSSGPTSHRKVIPEQQKKNELISKLLKNSSFLLFKN